MNSYQLNYLFDADYIIKKQEEWRRKQFNIFYGSGRPIFNITKETEHLRFHRSPAHTKDVNIRTYLYTKPKNAISNIQSESIL
jgi:hypothetical protein